MPINSSTRKSWHEKLHNGQEPKIVKIPREGWKRMGGATMLVSTPLDVDAAIRTVPKGKLVTSAQLRSRLAKDHGAECACPTSTGIFVRIAAEAAEEDLAQGKKKITPWWRVIKIDGSLNEKFPGGAELQAERLETEGHAIIPATAKRPPKVEKFEGCLVKW
jgi:hypothetical protein